MNKMLDTAKETTWRFSYASQPAKKKKKDDTAAAFCPVAPAHLFSL